MQRNTSSGADLDELDVLLAEMMGDKPAAPTVRTSAPMDELDTVLAELIAALAAGAHPSRTRQAESKP